MPFREGLTATGRWISLTMDHVSRSGGIAAGILLCVIVLIMTYEVVMRYFFTMPTIWVFEISHYLEAALFTWGLAYALNEGAHITVDFLRTRLSPKALGWLEAVTSSFSVLVILAIFWAMRGSFIRVVERREVSSTLLAVPLQWPLLGVLIGLAIFVFQSIVVCWRNWQKAVKEET